MASWHINKKGFPAECDAREMPCPLGGEHFESREQAELSLRGDADLFGAKKKSVPRESEKPQEPVMNAHAPAAPQEQPLRETPMATLASLMSTEQLQAMVREGYVNVSAHPQDPDLKVLCYSTMTQIKGKWNEVTKQARGLVIRSSREDFADAVVVERPWRKFFTLQQMTSQDGKPAWSLGDEGDDAAPGAATDALERLDFDAPAEVTDKVDGSMCVLYVAPDGDVAVTTKGSFTSEQGKHFTRVLRESPAMRQAARRLKREHPDKTFVFEGVSPKYPIVLAYEKDDLRLLGTIEKDTGRYGAAGDVQDIWSPDQGLTVTDTLPAKTLREAVNLPDREEREGVVVRVYSDDPQRQMQVKIKQADYLALHRLIDGVNVDGLREHLRESGPVKLSFTLAVAEDEDVEHIPAVKEVLSQSEQLARKTPRAALAHERNKRLLKNALVPHARHVQEARAYVESYPQNEGQDEAAYRKGFAAEANKLPKEVRGHAFNLFNERLRGKRWEDMELQGWMRKAAMDIKSYKDGEEE